MTTPNGLFTQGSTQTKVLRNQWILGFKRVNFIK